MPTRAPRAAQTCRLGPPELRRRADSRTTVASLATLATAADVLSARVEHDRVVTASIVLDDLTTEDEVEVGALFARVGQPSQFRVEATMSPDSETVETVVYKNGVETGCAPDRRGADVDFARDRVTIWVARSCLGTPAAFRWGVQTATYAPASVFIDDARRDGTSSGLTHPRLTGKVRYR